MTLHRQPSATRTRVRGRWELQTIDGFATHAGPHTVAWGEFVEGKVPVVPCDEAAVERVARELCRPHDWDESDKFKRHYLSAARAALAAAGRTGS